MDRPRKAKKVFPVDNCGENSCCKKDLILDLELWGWGFLDFVCFAEEGLSWLWIEGGEGGK